MKHFTISELTRSATATHLKIDNTPSEEAVKNLHHLVDNVLDPLREMWHAPIIVTSGYRCEALNTAVHGAPYSYHRLGMAADIRPERGRLDGLYDLIQHLFQAGELGITECYMDERKGYIHIAYDKDAFNVWPFSLPLTIASQYSFGKINLPSSQATLISRCPTGGGTRASRKL